MASAWSLLLISLLLLTHKTFTLLGIFLFPLVTFCLLWLKGWSINAMSPRHPNNLYDLVPCHWATSPTAASPQTSGQPRLLPYLERNSQALKTLFLLCPNANLSLSTSASIHLLRDSSPDHPLSGVPPTTYYGVQLVFSRAKLQAAVKFSKQQPQATFLSGKISLYSSLWRGHHLHRERSRECVGTPWCGRKLTSWVRKSNFVFRTEMMGLFGIMLNKHQTWCVSVL